MSNNFPDQNHIAAKLSSAGKNDGYFHSLSDGVDIDDLTLPYDHMYASSNSVVNGVEPSDGNCQESEESEVKFLKEWLVIHLDLIQQQNDEILSKDKTIFVLKQENEKLKERLLFIEKDVSVQNDKVVNNHRETEVIAGNLEDMTQDLTTKEEIDNKTVDCIEGVSSIFNFDDSNEKKLNCTITNHIHREVSLNQADITNHLDKVIIKSPVHMNHVDTLAKYEGSYTIHNSIENDSMKNLKMSIRRKRLCSNSSAFSNNDSASDDKKNYRRSRKRRKKSFNPDQILLCSEQYVTHAGETNYSITNPSDLTNDLPATNSGISNLEVPRWRIKSYTSCYTMEGTENLDDDAFNKRHARLEYDERRRKRWDVQRIREQRLIEKLKQRQEKVGANSRNDESDPLETLLPTLDDIKYIEVCDTLPVSAFGSPLTKVQYSEFSLPWLNNPNSGTSRRGISKRQRAKRRVNSKR